MNVVQRRVAVMPMSTTERRNALRDRLIDLARAQIAEGGLNSLRARDLAQKAECALGAIYVVFGDLGDIVLAVNTQTFDSLGKAIRSADRPADPAGQLIGMARAYHAFARDNRHLWRALFDIERPPGTRAPDWYIERMDALLALIEGPLLTLMAGTDPAMRRNMARTLFGAVHGIVHLSLDEAGAGLPGPEVDDMVALLLRRFAGEAG
jgi:AcrR family transcriptional regulator